MTPRRMLLTAIFCLAPGLAGADANTKKLGINIYGLSHHWEREEAKRIGTDHEFNPGLGLRYDLSASKLCRTPFVEAAGYRDSGANTAVYAALGCKGWKLAENVYLGGALAAFHSDTYNQGDPFIAPVPLLSWKISAATLNFIHFPRVKGFNDINTTGLYLTLPVR
ncbi:MAG: hypothetical protein B7Y41_10340 [Hydrogenophilales bacterium 28-61-23]|nr:MAG: hypothetical protein B7Y41_10340 [Hydrogenophilales bacterium 28-61-23]